MKQLAARVAWWMALALLFSGTSGAFAGECSPVSLASLQKKLEQANTNIQLVDYPAALTSLEEAERMLTCAVEVVPGSMLGLLYTYRGLALHFLSNEPEARNAFLNAQVVDPNLRWDDNYGQRPRVTFLDAREQMLASPRLDLQVPGVQDGVRLYVNGQSAATNTSVGLRPGRHLLQIALSDGSWRGQFFEVADGKSLTLPIDASLLGTGGGTRAANEARSSGGGAGLRVPFFASAGMAVLGGATTIGTAAQFWQTRGELLDNYYQNETDPVREEERDSLLQRNRRAALLCNVSVGVTVLAGAGAALLFPGAFREQESTRTAPRVLPMLTADTFGVLLEGRF